jgi:hypothetical protein
MLFDTDILIWVQRGNEKAARLVERTADRNISIQTFMELLQCAQSKTQLITTKNFLAEFNFEVLPFMEKIGHSASIYVEEYSLASGLRAGDAIVAATAVENNLKLITGNRKHFKSIKDLQLKIFRP